MQIPTVARARDLLVSVVSSLQLLHYVEQWNGTEVELIPALPDPWISRPDPDRTRSHVMAWTADDALFTGRAYWLVTRRYVTGYPAAFMQLPSADVTLNATTFHGNAPVGPYSVWWNGQQIANDDVVIFYSPNAPVLTSGARHIRISERLDLAAERFAATPAAFGWLEQTEGEPLSGDELADLANAWTVARDTSAIAALSGGVKWNESGMDPSRLQLVEARQHEALEIARIVGVSPSLVGAPTGSSLTYSTVEMALAQLVLDAGPYLDMIEQTLSGDRVIPRGHVVRFDRSPLAAGREASPLNREEIPA